MLADPNWHSRADAEGAFNLQPTPADASTPYKQGYVSTHKHKCESDDVALGQGCRVKRCMVGDVVALSVVLVGLKHTILLR